MSNTVTISKKEYRDLLIDSALLARLEAAGVDNWEGWDYARGNEYDPDGIDFWEEKELLKQEWKDE